MNEARTDRLSFLEKDHPRHALSVIEDLITGVFFLCAPYTYVDRLENVWADRTVSLAGWQKLVASLLVEWSDSNLLVSTSVYLFIAIV